MADFSPLLVLLLTLLGWIAPVAGRAGAPALPGTQEPLTVRSQSGQFLVRGLPTGAAYWRSSTSAVEYLRLDPTLTAVSLERIRQVLYTELSLTDPWRGLVTVTTRPVTEDQTPPRVTAVRFKDSWGYRLDFPEHLEKGLFMKAAVGVMLMEIANRQALTAEAELPPWLAEGLAAELSATSLSILALEPGREVKVRDRNVDALRSVRERLRQRPALGFNDLCLPGPAQFEGTGAAAHYQACSQLFVHELLRLRGGRESLREMLLNLHRNLNWQTTFLQAFHAHFPRLIDVDKWYAVSTVNISSRDPMSVWPLEATRRQLDEILLTPVEVRMNAGELPIRTQVSLQRIVAEWEFARQQPVLLAKLQQLQSLSLRAAPACAPLIQGYIGVLQTYAVGRNPRTKARSARLAAAARQATQELEALDARRQKLDPP